MNSAPFSLAAPPSGDALAHLVAAANALAQLDPSHGKLSATTSSLSSQTEDYLSVVSNDDEEERDSGIDSPTKSSGLASPKSPTKRELFPQRLLAILSDESLSDVIAWLPHGKSFVVIRPDVFTETVLPKYLPPTDARTSTKYASFTRKLNRWGFRQATRGPDTGAFTHPLFQKDKPELCNDMVCRRTRDPKSASSKTAKTGKTCEFSPLTESSLAAMTRDSSPAAKAAVAVSVTSEVRSDDTPPPQLEETSASAMLERLLANRAIVDAVLKQRDELERRRIAQAMLYESYMQALLAQPPDDCDSS